MDDRVEGATSDNLGNEKEVHFAEAENSEHPGMQKGPEEVCLGRKDKSEKHTK